MASPGQANRARALSALAPSFSNVPESIAEEDEQQQDASSVPVASSYREPIRSSIHTKIPSSPKTAIDSAQFARSVREDTEELASFLLADHSSSANRPLHPCFRERRRSYSPSVRPRLGSISQERPSSNVEGGQNSIQVGNDRQPESRNGETSPSMLTSLLRHSPPEDHQTDHQESQSTRPKLIGSTPLSSYEFDDHDETEDDPSETTPLIVRVSPSSSTASISSDTTRHRHDIESQKTIQPVQWFRYLLHRYALRSSSSSSSSSTLLQWKSSWIVEAFFLAPIRCFPAVCVGLLLNILDALSYGMILFPLSNPIFSHLGPAGVSIFYVSTVVSQLTFSTGSIFKGGVGSELIEVVPFFHSMANTITKRVGSSNPDAVIATTIVSYALSSMVTGLVFYLMGKFHFGYMVGFIPRHILIGCIGGVGFFLIATGFEVTSRLDGSLQFDLATLQSLLEPSRIPLWLLPLALAILLFFLHSRIHSKYFLPCYILTIPTLFYFASLFLPWSLDDLRDEGWVFRGPATDEPWWYFYTLYQVNIVRWDAVLETIPAMFALTFFGVLHVPINVPALALNTGEDNADLDWELKLHGFSNFVSGMVGSIQNYLVYANTIFFVRSGGDSRLAGYLLTILTVVIMMIGPSLISFIPIMMVGTLIFDLGFELLLEAVWLPRKKLKFAEYLTVIVIVLIMGTYDFVIGIGVGILLAFVSMIVQASRVPAIRATYSGDVVTSTVRRNAVHCHYLHQVGRQTMIYKLSGYLFFGTIVTVEEKIRELVEGSRYQQQPIRYLIVDMWNVTGLDYSAGEAFNTIHRVLCKKGVELIFCGVSAESEIGRSLQAAGLCDSDQDGSLLLPDLNSALENCENELLMTFHRRQEASVRTSSSQTPQLTAVAAAAAQPMDTPRLGQRVSLDFIPNSPRAHHLHQAAHNTISDSQMSPPTRWQGLREPLRLILQIFRELSPHGEDFWFRATPFFHREEYAAGTILYGRGDMGGGFYLVEQGLVRMEYDLPQGNFSESIVAGTTCGELPFFSETPRTATAVVERHVVVWVLDRLQWQALQKREPEVAQELLKVSLKLTSERLSAITSYILAMAG